MTVWHLAIPDEARLRLLAEACATKLIGGDMLTLQGNLGAGKTTFCRYIIRALLGRDSVEVPSPTFTLVQSYETPRFSIRHFDLYRLSGADELDELEFEDPEETCVTLVEWPERAGEHLGACRFDIVIADGDDEQSRRVTISATPTSSARLDRLKAGYEFLCNQVDAGALARSRIAYLQGDASARAYSYVRDDGQSRILMDSPRMPDGPVIRDGRTYSEIAHLAEDIRPFIAIDSELRAAGLSAPEIYAYDALGGFALIEDLGALTFGDAMARGHAQDALWRAAVDVLVRLRGTTPPPIAGAGTDVAHRLPIFDSGVMRAELALICDWYWPHALGRSMTPDERSAFDSAWSPYLELVACSPSNTEPSAWLLRDYHSPNLIWMPSREGLARVGIIDFQDAQIGHAAYDLVSLSLDARLDVPRPLHDALIDHYCASVSTGEPTFDEAAFRRAAAIIGAQRNTKILGIFARLAMRDGKDGYLRHIPRIKRYLGWCLEHPELQDLAVWYRSSLDFE